MASFSESTQARDLERLVADAARELELELAAGDELALAAAIARRLRGDHVRSKEDEAMWIRGLRQLLHLTQVQLAARIGVTPVTVARWEAASSSPSPLCRQALRRLAEERQ